MIIQTPRLTLSPLIHSDAVALLSLLRHSEHDLKPWFNWMQPFPTLDILNAQLQHDARLLEEGIAYSLGIFLNPDRRLCGSITLGPASYDIDITSIGYWLDRSVYGNGYATEAVLGVLEWYFIYLKRARLTAFIPEGNRRSVALVERLSFHYEGVLRRAHLVRATRLNLSIYSLLSEEYADRRKGLRETFLEGNFPRIRDSQ